jgi:predicted alpha/beta superfamily hydrolase
MSPIKKRAHRLKNLSRRKGLPLESAVLELDAVESIITAEPNAWSGTEGSTLTGDFRLHRAFPSSFLKHERDVLVLLPPGYSVDTDRHYPVLYVQDGQNLFDAATAFGGNEWHVDETAGEMTAKGEIEPLIIVGIYNTGAHRIAEYTPSRDKKQNAGGEGRAYGRFVVEELKPFIDSTYRTRADRDNTGVAGSSLGGLISLYLALHYPHVFGRVAAMSPSIWWDRRMILRLVRALKRSTEQRIWIDAGTDEGRTTVHNARDLKDLLVQKGWREGENLAYLEVQGAGHNEGAWAARFGAVLGFLFPRKN